MQSTGTDSCCQSQKGKPIKGPAMLPLEAGCIKHTAYGAISISSISTMYMIVYVLVCTMCLCVCICVYHCILLYVHIYEPYMGFMEVHE